MPLSGTFDVLDFSDVLHLVADHELTGRLHARTRNYTTNLFWEEGRLVGADQSDHQPAAVSGDVWGRLEEICFELLGAERGSFEFHPGRPASTAAQRLEVDEVLERANARLQEWQELQALIPSLDLQPRLVGSLDQAEITLDRERWRMLTAVDGRRNLHAIGRTLNLSDFEVCRLCKMLVDAGVVELEGRAAAIASAAVGPDAEKPPITETVTTVSGKQAVKASAPVSAGDLGASPARPETNTHSTKTVRTVTIPSEEFDDDGGDADAGDEPEAEDESAHETADEAPTPAVKDDETAPADATTDTPAEGVPAVGDHRQSGSGRRRRIVRIRSRGRARAATTTSTETRQGQVARAAAVSALMRR